MKAFYIVRRPHNKYTGYTSWIQRLYQYKRVLLATCTWGDIHPGWVKPASSIEFTISRKDAFQARSLRLAGHREAAHAFQWPPVRLSHIHQGSTRTQGISQRGQANGAFFGRAVLVYSSTVGTQSLRHRIRIEDRQNPIVGGCSFSNEPFVDFHSLGHLKKLIYLTTYNPQCAFH